MMDVALGGGGSEYVNDYVARERDCARPPEKPVQKELELSFRCKRDL